MKTSRFGMYFHLPRTPEPTAPGGTADAAAASLTIDQPVLDSVAGGESVQTRPSPHHSLCCARRCVEFDAAVADVDRAAGQQLRELAARIDRREVGLVVLRARRAQVPVGKGRTGAAVGGHEDLASGVIGAGGLRTGAVVVAPDQFPAVGGRIAEVEDAVPIEPVGGAHIGHVAAVFFGITGAAIDEGLVRRGGDRRSALSQLSRFDHMFPPTISGYGATRCTCDPVLPPTRSGWDARGVEQVRAGLAAGGGGVERQKVAAVAVGGATQDQHAVDARKVHGVVVGVGRGRCLGGAVDRIADAQRVLHHLAGQGGALPTLGRCAPQVDVVAGVVGMAAAIEQQGRALRVPGKGTPRQDDLRRRRVAGRAVQRPQRRGRPHVGKAVQVDLAPAALGHGGDLGQQVAQVGRGRGGIERSLTSLRGGRQRSQPNRPVRRRPSRR